MYIIFYFVYIDFLISLYPLPVRYDPRFLYLLLIVILFGPLVFAEIRLKHLPCQGQLVESLV